MSGAGGGWAAFLLFNIIGMSVLCLLLALVTRRLLHGATLVAATVALSFVVWLALAASGMARSDFGLLFVAPIALCAAIVAGIWLIALKMQVLRG